MNKEDDAYVSFNGSWESAHLDRILWLLLMSRRRLYPALPPPESVLWEKKFDNVIVKEGDTLSFTFTIEA